MPRSVVTNGARLTPVCLSYKFLAPEQAIGEANRSSCKIQEIWAAAKADNQKTKKGQYKRFESTQGNSSQISTTAHTTWMVGVVPSLCE
jgi:hypothetical protein